VNYTFIDVLILYVIINVFGFYNIVVAFTCRFGKVLSGLQPTFVLQCGGTTNLTSVKIIRKLVSVALEVKIKTFLIQYIFSLKEKLGPFLVHTICGSHLISGINQSKSLLSANQLLKLMFI
jgi:hypothetical protein